MTKGGTPTATKGGRGKGTSVEEDEDLYACVIAKGGKGSGTKGGRRDHFQGK
jgi:hypothetical protein